MGHGILFLGDLYYDYTDVSDDIKELGQWIRENNLVTVLNLEGSFRAETATPIKKRGPNLSLSSCTVEVLRELNTIGVCLSNNHMMDFGEQSLIYTLDILKRNRINFTGAGKTLEDAVHPMFIETNGTKIAILNFGWDAEETIYAKADKAGCSPRKREVIFQAVSDAQNSSDHCVLFMHWGFEYNRLPMPFDMQLAHELIEKGADIVIGSHPHNIQPKELFKDKHIYYSLGNFYFASRRERFKKNFNESVANICDYGAGVIWDSCTGKTREILLRYNRSRKCSEIINDDDLLGVLMEDITGTDYTTKEYLKLVSNRKQNRNPILTTNELYNTAVMAKFEQSRSLRNFIRKSLIR